MQFSVGLKLGLLFLSGAITYDPLVSETDALSASKVVLLDSMIINIDRTAKNTNLLIWNRELWLIDHGASLYFHHNWKNWESHLTRSFPNIKDHVLLSRATELEQAVQQIQESLNEGVIQEIVDSIPEDWLVEEGRPLSPSEKRAAYVTFLMAKLSRIESFAKEAADAR